MVIECCDCKFEFEREDNVFVCERCKKPVCDDCKEDHNCLEADYFNNETCSECGNCEEDMKQCPDCEDTFCNNCIEEHMKEDKVKEKPDDYDNSCCKDCGDCQEEMTTCPICDDCFCPDCIDGHLQDEMKEVDFEELKYGEYAKENICDKLSKGGKDETDT